MKDGIGTVTLGLGGDAKVRAKGAKLSESTTEVLELMEKGEPLGQTLTASGMANSAVDLAGDPSSLGYFVPKNGRQAVEAGAVPGGELLIGLENAWKAGSAKDRAAHAGT